MAEPISRDQAASVAARLRNAGRELGLSAEQLQVMPVQMAYAQQGFLGRLDASVHAERFVIKGGASLFTRFRQLGRPTRDLDLAALGPPPPLDEVLAWIHEICAAPFGDSLVFAPEDIRARSSAPESAAHPVVQVSLVAVLGRARQPLDLDVSFGNVIYPGLVQAHFPRLVIPEPVLVRIYPLEQVVTEKFAVMLELTVANSRMKDLHDLWQIARAPGTQGAAGMRAADLAQAMRASFAVRRTPTANLALVLDPAFAQELGLLQAWAAYRRRNTWARLPELADILSVIRAFPGAVAQRLPWESSGVWDPVKLSWQ
ncbi:nucleotidyl transferase AbiEii/AbiGii toxin family protein [Deinococcus sp.]|uniref:nucleotidyl transferase AbiEii/AbiGii toxin family protein n=1 Tax=Deinococcus sp. TaxID=47478 RepID=UPI0025FFAD24|nr:nucleotidyl transferase AbiEii/AbiGii toxin family protein [Deinococcus sp.]